jgi:hypothetical protein
MVKGAINGNSAGNLAVSDEYKQTTLATACVAFLVFVAFLGAYAGQSQQLQTGWADSWHLSDKIALIAVVVGFSQFVALIWTAYVMRASAQRQLRAYVHISDPTRVGVHQDAPEFSFLVKNFGQTPARKGTFWYVTDKGNYHKVSGFKKPPGVGIGQFELAPLGTITITGANSTEPKVRLTGEEMTEFQGGTFALFVFGEFAYIDVFNKRRTTKFRLRYGRDSVYHSRLSNCEEGNDST